MSRNDQVIDDDEPDTCPLCIEELDLSDRNFRPCPCGYQVCQFCYNNIKTTMNGLCPACRRQYDDKNIKFDAPTAEDVVRYKENQANRERKARAAKKQEAATRQADSLSRKHLAGIRVRRQNLVYVTGLRLNTSDPQLGEKLRGDQFFGQYGRIDKIVVNRPKDSRALQPVGVYITFFDKEAAALCIDLVNNSSNAGGTVRADYGTTKYCSAFLRHEICTNKNCTFLHEVGDDNESFTREGLSSLNAISSQEEQSPPTQDAEPAPQQLIPQPHHFPAISESMQRTESRDGAASGIDADFPAMPTATAWNRPPGLSRRASLARTSASASPMPAAAASLAKPQEQEPINQESTVVSAPASPPTVTATIPASNPRPDVPNFGTDIMSIRRLLATTELHFELDTSRFSKADKDVLSNMPPLFDSDGGMKRQMVRKPEFEQERLHKDYIVGSQALSAMPPDDNPEGGSLQLGGEPDERHGGDESGRRNLPVGPPSDLMSPTFNLAHILSPESQPPALSGRSSILQNQHLPQQYKSPSPGFPGQGFQHNVSAQASHFGVNGHARQNSRFSFANDLGSSNSSVKATSNPKFSNQQSSHITPPSQYSGSNSHYFTSGVQGPPPGLKATGTPPVSGGGMFGQGHGFATAGLGYGSSGTNSEMMRQMFERNRGGSTGSGQTSEGGRREYMISPFSHQSHYPSPAHHSGLSSSSYGAIHGALQDHGSQNQKRKGKKHRHANTSSSGGGVVDHADPGILQSRMHQAGSGNHGQYGTQGQDFSADVDASFQKHEDPFVSTSDERFAAFSSSLFGGFGPHRAPSHPPGLNHAERRGRAARRRPIFQAQPRSTQDELPPMPGLGIDAKASYAPYSYQAEVKISLADPAPEQPSPATRFEKAMFGEDKPTKTTADLDETSFPALPTPISSQIMAERQKRALETASRGQVKRAKAQKEDTGNKEAAMVTKPPKGHELDRENRKPIDMKNKDEKRKYSGKMGEDAKWEEVIEDVRAAAERLGTTRKSPRADVPETEATTSSPNAPAPTTGTGLGISHVASPPTPALPAATPMKRTPQPETLRVTSTHTAETPSTPVRATTPTILVKQALHKATPAASRQSSRRPSVSSSVPSRNPDQEMHLDTESLATESPSRASSPAPIASRVGSAPVRSKTKSQVKKDRQERAKTLVDDPSDAGTGTLSEAVEVAPVMGRQTKKSKAKKSAGRTNGPSKANTPDVSRPASPGPTPTQERVVTDVPVGKGLVDVEEAPSRKVPPESSIADVLAEAKTEKAESISPTGIIKDLKASGALGAEFAKLFLEPILRASNGKPDLLTVDDIWSLATPKTLTPTEVQDLKSGLAIRREGPNSKASSRLMISPTWKCLPRLTKEQEDRYLELEKKVLGSKAPYKYTHQRQKDKLVNALTTIDDMLKDMTAILTRPPKTNVRNPPPAFQRQSNAKPARKSSGTGSTKPRIQPPPQPSYATDALAYLNQYILPPLPSAPRPNPLKPQTVAASQADCGAQGMPQAPATALTALGTAIPRTYTTGNPTYSVNGVQGPAAAPLQSNTGAMIYTSTSHTTTTTGTTTHASSNAQPNSSATLDIQKLIHGDFGKLTQSDIKKLRKEDIDRLSPSDISALAQNAANAAAAAVGDLRSLNFAGSLGPDAGELRNADFEKIQNLGSKALKGQALSGADLANLRSLGSGSSALPTAGGGALSQTASAEAIKTALANAVNGVVQAAAAVANQTQSSNQITRGPEKLSDDILERTALSKEEVELMNARASATAALSNHPPSPAPSQQVFGTQGQHNYNQPVRAQQTSSAPLYPQKRPPTVEEVAKALELAKEENRGYDRRMVGMVKRNRKVSGLV